MVSARLCDETCMHAPTRRCTVLPFGVTNGPSYFQEFKLDVFGGWQLGIQEKTPPRWATFLGAHRKDPMDTGKVGEFAKRFDERAKCNRQTTVKHQDLLSKPPPGASGGPLGPHEKKVAK